MSIHFIWAAVAVAAYIAGLKTHRTYGLARHVYYHLKHGICFRYKPTGYIETRDGTVSDFCQKCGHPHGYHNWD